MYSEITLSQSLFDNHFQKVVFSDQCVDLASDSVTNGLLEITYVDGTKKIIVLGKPAAYVDFEKCFKKCSQIIQKADCAGSMLKLLGQNNWVLHGVREITYIPLNFHSLNDEEAKKYPTVFKLAGQAGEASGSILDLTNAPKEIILINSDGSKKSFTADEYRDFANEAVFSHLRNPPEREISEAFIGLLKANIKDGKKAQ